MAAEPNASTVDRGRVGLWKKIFLYVAAWLVALIAADPSLKSWTLVYLFPFGLAACFSLRLGNNGSSGVLIGCSFIYLVQAYFYFRTNKLPATAIWFAVLVILLVCNVSGCRAQLPQR